MARIILFRGKAGTGKSTLSNELARILQLPVLHKDDIYDSVAGFVPEHSSRNQICFDILYRFLEHTIGANAAVILDFGFNNLEDVGRLEGWIEARGGELIKIRCVCSDETVWSDRLAVRKARPLPNQLITSLSGLKEHYKNSGPDFIEDELIVDTSVPLESSLQHIRSFLRSAGSSQHRSGTAGDQPNHESRR
ncbi:Predicted kinase [Paenibacillus sp. UNCCL117]|uniref:AAA family ATPase n=1 Tax=unclassified Paenibacillus TaxID=185978 RepID=UPI000885C8ED|nr:MULTISPECIES: AAA family ATPase [unclassified Paenibacillus]SDD49605.1 Predicted kinase [Paenibacillus sp. cl123]SFW49921.1 Predicted kinase [Paenibacillus sp. UNCCL117]